MVAEGDCRRSGNGEIARAAHGAIALNQSPGGGIVPRQVQRSALNLGRAGDRIGSVDVDGRTAAQPYRAGRCDRPGIEVMGATTEAEHRIGGHVEVAAVRTAIGEIEDAGLNIDRAGIVEGNIDRCDVVD